MTITVAADGTWTYDISDLVNTPDNDNEFFTATQVDAAGNESDRTDKTHYFHGDYNPAQTDVSDDYALFGEGDDKLYVNDDDSNDQLTADGGAGTDTAVLNFASSDATITLGANGEIIITETTGSNDINTFIEFEVFEFTDGSKTKDELFAPTVTISDDDDTLSLTELEGKVQYTIGLPPGAVAGAVLILSLNGVEQAPYTLTDADIQNGSIEREVDGSSINTTLDNFTVEAEIQYQGFTSASAQDSVEINDAPVANNDTFGLQGSYYGWEQSVQGSNLDSIQEARDYLAANEADATFNAKEVSYERGEDNLGTGDSLQDFLGDDAATLSNDPSDTSDAFIHLEGAIYLESGDYKFSVTADDGYAIVINGETVAIYDGTQSQTTREHGVFDIASDGYYNIEIIYFDQGGAYVFKPELGKVEESGTVYKPLNEYTLSNNVLTTDEDNALTIDSATLLANDSDPNGDTITITSVQAPANAQWSVELDSNGNVLFTPNDDFNGVADFTYTITDEHGDSATATVTVNVVAVNDAPVASDDTAITTDEDTAVSNINVLGNDTDVDGDTLTVTGASAENGTVTINADGTLNYTPNGDYNGSDTITYTISDGQGGTDTATIAVTVNPVNDAPVANDDTAITTEEDTTVSNINVLGNDTDADGDTLTVTGASAENGTVTINADGTLNYTPNGDYNGSDTITYTISDGKGGTDTATIAVTVSPVNDTPVVTPTVEFDAVEDNGSLTGAVSVTDVDSGAFTFTIVGNTPAGFNLDADGNWSFDTTDVAYDAMAVNETQRISVTVEVSDGEGGTVQQVIHIDITGTNDNPTAEAFIETLTNDGSVQFTFDEHVSDVEDDRSSTDAKETTIVDIEDGQFGSLYIVDGDQRTPIDANTVLDDDAVVEYQLRDDLHDYLSFDASEDLPAGFVNGATSTISLDNGTVISGGRFTGQEPYGSGLSSKELYYDGADNETGLGVGDAEIDVTQKDYIAVEFADGVMVTEANVSFGSVWAHYEDGHVADAQVVVLLINNETNQYEKVIFDDSDLGYYDGSGEFVANVTSSNGFDEIRIYTEQGDASNADSGKNSNITFQGIDIVDAEVSEVIDYTAKDSDGGEHSSTVTIDVDSTKDALNDAPTIGVVAFSDSAQEDTAITLDLNEIISAAQDADGDEIVITGLTVDAQYGELTLTESNGQITGAVFTPAKDIHTADGAPVEFNVTISDGLHSVETTANIDIAAVADAPDVSITIGNPTTVEIYTGNTEGRTYTDLATVKNEYGRLKREGDDNQNHMVDGVSSTGILYIGHGMNDTIQITHANVTDDVLIGDDGILGNNDTGISVNDTLDAGAGNDILIGEEGWDALYGDEGIDTAVYAGNFADYEIKPTTYSSTSFTVTDLNTSEYDEGTDTLHDIEYLQFADGVYHNVNGEWVLATETFLDYPIDIDASVTDTDGSEVIDSIVITGLPDGASIVDANGNVVGSADGNGNWTIPIVNGQQSVSISGLAVRAPEDANVDITVTATSIETSTQGTASESTASSSEEAAAAHDIFVDQGGSTPTTLVTLVIDSSGSMDFEPYDDVDNHPDEDKMRIEIVLEASIAMLENLKTQEGWEDVLVQLVDFDDRYSDSSDSSATSLGWYSVNDAISTLTTAKDQLAAYGDNYSGVFKPQGGTDYEEAAYAVMGGYESTTITSIEGETNDVIYFLSDGESNGGWGGGSTGPRDEWEEFIAGKDVQAVGIVRDDQDKSGLDDLSLISSNVTYLSDSEIKTELPKLVPTIGQAGQLTSGITGQDAASVVIDVDKLSVLKMIDNNGNDISNQPVISEINGQLKVETQYGDLLIESDGSYYFQPISGAPVIDSGEAVGLEILYTVADSNGNESEQLLSVNISPSYEANAAVLNTVNASTGDDVIEGTNQDDIILGHQGDDTIDGGLGADILIGGEGDDLLLGGLGNDILTGGEGSDTFVFELGSLGASNTGDADVITDFSILEGDKLDLSDLFSDLQPNDPVSNYLNISDDADGNAVVTVNKGGESFTVEFEGVSSADLTNYLYDPTNPGLIEK
uniref:tandem-95 repeat protein n=1 Tax=Thaumasiovibrio subtropicus TaxID=1891207 RepID=UPI00131E17CB|nr:tandem-95 repeat protein [Thaumasiovibrio subtropicus]